MAGALSSDDPLGSYEDAAMQQSNAPTNNPNDYGALSQATVPLAPEDIQNRKDVFNQATQRLLQARQQMQAPYQGEDLGGLALSASMGKASGMPVAEGYTQGMFDKAKAEQVQREAQQAYQQQQLGMGLRASMAQIMASPSMSDEDKIQSIYQMSALSGDAEGGKNAAAMMRAMHTGVAGRAVSVLNEQGQPELISAQDAVKRHLAPIIKDEQGRIMNSPANGIASTLPPKIQQIWQDNKIQPARITKDEFKDNEKDYQDATKAHDAAMEAARIATEAETPLKNYVAGSGDFLENTNAFLGGPIQSLTNRQEINKLSGQIASQIAQQSHSIRIGVGIEKFAKSTTIDKLNSPEANAFIVNNIKDFPAITMQRKNIEAYVKQFPPQQKESIKDAFYQDYPLMIDNPSGKTDDPAIVNPAYKDNKLFAKWMQGQAVSPENATKKTNNISKPDTAPQILSAPPPVSARVKGQTYPTPKGNMTWMGDHWTPAGGQ